MTNKTDTEQLRAEFEAWYVPYLYTGPNPPSSWIQRGEDGKYVEHKAQVAFDAYQAGRAALQSQDREEIMEMALCESRRLVLRVGQAYRFVPMKGCKTCEEMKAEHDQAYGIGHARRVEGDGE